MADRLTADPQKAAYAAPTITVVAEDDLLKTFQVTSATTTWWVPGIGGSG